MQCGAAPNTILTAVTRVQETCSVDRYTVWAHVPNYVLIGACVNISKPVTLDFLSLVHYKFHA